MKPDLRQMFQVVAGRHSYYVRTTIQYDMKSGKPVSYGIDCGGKMKGCVLITVEVPNRERMADERFARFEEDKFVAYVSWIGYDPKCSVNSNLPHGDGTRHLIKTSMSIACNICPWIKKFSLRDASKVRCVEGVDVSLSDLSFVTKGKSYSLTTEKCYTLFLCEHRIECFR